MINRTIAEALTLSEALPDSDSARLDVELLLCHCLQKNRTYLRAWPERELDDTQWQWFQALLARRRGGEPVAYLIGSRGFWSLELQVAPSTLIPRPDTELLVEAALARAAAAGGSLLDLGTGTGAIALALASELPRWQITACDFSAQAVALAKTNRAACGLDSVDILQSDWFTSIPSQRFSIIVSNPPYIDGDDPHLLAGDVRFEPRSALVAADNGLADIRHIADSACEYLEREGWLMFEHGFEQASSVRDILAKAGFSSLQTLKDLAGLDRVTLGQWQGGVITDE